MGFELTILGNNSAIPAHGRNPTAQVLRQDARRFLIDCGEGTQFQMSKYGVKRSKIDAVFISHIHGDHYLGLVGLIHSWQITGRKTPLTIYGPESLWPILDCQIEKETSFSISYKTTNPDNAALLFEDDRISIHAFPVFHRIHTTGFRFIEKISGRKINGEKINELNLSIPQILALKNGEDLIIDGEIIKNKSLTFNHTKPASYAFCADTLFDPRVAEAVKGMGLIYHEATYSNEHKDLAEERGHSTTSQAAEIAKMAGVEQLLIGHFSSKYSELEPLLKEAIAVFPNTAIAIQGNSFSI